LQLCIKLLVLSDIHNNLVAVRRMRDREPNAFDAVVVAGDIGSACAPRFFEILSTFKCPVLYVYGNWDHELEYGTAFAGDAHHLHLNVVEIGGYFFTGFSGCPTKWGKNPIALKLGDLPDAARQTLHLNRTALRRTIAPFDPRRTVIITHERLTKLTDVAADPLLHLYGHLHGFSERMAGATRCVNVSVLDRAVTARPQGTGAYERTELRNFNAGNYVIIEISDPGGIRVECRQLPHDYPQWTPLKDRRHNGIEWIPEELKWTDPTDPKIARYQESLSDK